MNVNVSSSKSSLILSTVIEHDEMDVLREGLRYLLEMVKVAIGLGAFVHMLRWIQTLRGALNVFNLKAQERARMLGCERHSTRYCSEVCSHL